jgi:hypothetical protein
MTNEQQNHIRAAAENKERENERDQRKQKGHEWLGKVCCGVEKHEIKYR